MNRRERYEIERYERFMAGWAASGFLTAICTKCKALKPDIGFHKRSALYPGGPAHLCLECTSDLQMETKRYNQARDSHRKRGGGKITLTLKEWWNIVESQSNKCTTCGIEFNRDTRATIDHIIPASAGGELSKENVQALCGRCNSKKSDSGTRRQRLAMLATVQADSE